MKQFILLISILLGTSAWADMQTSVNNPFKALNSAWQTQQHVHPQQQKNDIHMVYGGADIIRKVVAIDSTIA